MKKITHLLSFWFPPVPWRAWRTSRLESLFGWGKCGFQQVSWGTSFWLKEKALQVTCWMEEAWVSTSVLKDPALAQGRLREAQAKNSAGHLLYGKSDSFTFVWRCLLPLVFVQLPFFFYFFLISFSLPPFLPPSLSLSLSLCLCSTSDLGSLFSWDNSGPSGHLLLTNAVRLHSTMGLKTFTLLQLCNPSGLLLKAKLFHITSALQSLFLEPPLSQSGVLQDTCWNPHFPHPKSDLSRDVLQALQGTGGNQKDSKWVIFFILLFLPQEDCFDVSKNQLAALGILNHEYLNVFLLVVVLLLFFLPVACSSLFLLVFFVIPLVDDDLSSFSFLLPFL